MSLYPLIVMCARTLIRPCYGLTSTTVISPTPRVAQNQPVPHFNPESVEKYIAQLEQLAKVKSWDEHTLVYMATSNLKGMAKVWYEAQK